jgi:hypothetical protein
MRVGFQLPITIADAVKRVQAGDLVLQIGSAPSGDVINV